jgi:hypothetical protein
MLRYLTTTIEYINGIASLTASAARSLTFSSLCGLEAFFSNSSRQRQNDRPLFSSPPPRQLHFERPQRPFTPCGDQTLDRGPGSTVVKVFRQRPLSFLGKTGDIGDLFDRKLQEAIAGD